MTDPNNTYISN